MKTIKKFKILIIFILIIIIIIGLLIFLTCWSNETKTLLSQYSLTFVTGIGFIFVLYEFIIKRNYYLDLLIKIKKDNSFYSIKTQVINKSGENKDIYFAFILITEQNADIIEKVKDIVNNMNLNIVIKHSNDFKKLEIVKNPIFINNTIGFIPLDFYFSENIGIGNENPCFTYTFDNSSNNINLNNGIYSARFFIYPQKGYHRSTSDSLIIQ